MPHNARAFIARIPFILDLNFCSSPDRLCKMAVGVVWIATSLALFHGVFAHNMLGGLDPRATTSVASAAPSPTLHIVQSVGGYFYAGCYIEATVGTRALAPGAYAYDSMTVESCASNCTGYTFFGVEYGRECKILSCFRFTHHHRS